MEGEFEEGPTSETNVKADETQDGPVDVEKASLTDELSSQDAPPRRIKKVPPPFSYKDHSPLAVAFINRYYHNQDAASTPPPASPGPHESAATRATQSDLQSIQNCCKS